VRPGPPGGAARACARGGVAPALLLDVQTPFGEVFYWSDRKLANIAPAITVALDQPHSRIVSIAWVHGTQTATIIFTKQTRYLSGSVVTLSLLATFLFLNGVSGTVTFPDLSDRSTLKFVPNVAIADGDVATAADPGIAAIVPPAAVDYEPWIVSTVNFNFNRSSQTDIGGLQLQNVSGDVLVRDFERIARRSVLEGSLYVLRYYSADLEWPWIEQHGTLSVGDAGTMVPITLRQLLDGSDDTPAQVVSENCQLVWGERRCGATGSTECLYTYTSCQVIEHFTGIQTGFEINNPAAAAVLSTQVINRKKAW
jgi:hypothetical protein